MVLTDKLKIFGVVILVAGTWIVNYLQDSLGYIAMFSSASWYWSFLDASYETGSAEVMSGVKTAHVNHLGSIAFGSLI